jgi:hypothetical protein
MTMIYAHTGATLRTATMIEPQPTQPAKPHSDPVNKPAHYTFGYFEVIEVLQDWFPANPLLWQVGKYIARAHHKGNALQDLRKARFYLEREIERLEDLSANQQPKNI